MTASGAAIGAFALVYLLALLNVGLLWTVVVGWLPAAIAGFFAARAVRQLMFSLFQLRPSDLLGLPSPRPLTVNVPLDDEFTRR